MTKKITIKINCNCEGELEKENEFFKNLKRIEKSLCKIYPKIGLDSYQHFLFCLILTHVDCLTDFGKKELKKDLKKLIKDIQ